ncbi:hypothetical protein LINPERHAP1_LOCUS10190 [Linum perenne]
MAAASLSLILTRCLPTPTTSTSAFLYPSSVFFRPSGPTAVLRSQQFCIRRNSRSTPAIVAAQSNFLRVIQTVWKVGRDGIDAGTRLVPESIPRPIARISAGVVLVTVSLFLIKSFLSTVFFALATMGLVYFLFIALNKDEDPKRGSDDSNRFSSSSSFSSEDEALKEARRIMEKYKK